MTMTGMMWMPTEPPDLARLLAVHLQPFPILPLITVGLLALYLTGVIRLRIRGDRWPVGRLIWWAAGIAVILVMTATGIDGYGMELFSVHMVQHMTLSMLAPVFLVLGAPVTLLLRTLPTRSGGRTSARTVVLGLLHSRFALFITHPVVSIALFLMSLYGLYFTPVFDYLMGTMWGHNLMLLHFLAIGFLYFWGVLGVDPSPRRASRGVRQFNGPVLRIFELFATVPFHAFFGVVVMMSVSLIVHFYAIPVPGWGISPLQDQQLGGGIAWGFTEIPTLVVLGVLFLQWQSSEDRLNRRMDRAERRREGEREAYNAFLASLAARDAGEPR
ncbi:cytochrome c oxidase assembly protein [Diaminobutyricibacter tongyongensis]|uniref:Cytochrome c oxidase assembly protein n=2 Tax=Leifsonia tongyongensis TaxID=1268043 RepID=A0A6L9XTQ8_9MICO|nr:cytochrome c oxidase assembly protein [Diaminobutyricibacter tongyongensis]